eukprot:gene3016-5910_t
MAAFQCKVDNLEILEDVNKGRILQTTDFFQAGSVIVSEIPAIHWASQKNEHSIICQYLEKSLQLSFDDDTDSMLRLILGVLYLRFSNQNELYASVCNQSNISISLSTEEESSCEKVFNLIHDITGPFEFYDISIEWIKELVKKDKSCGFAYMMPYKYRADLHEIVPSEDTNMIRGYGVLPKLALANHSCLPNAARWDHIDDINPNMNPNERISIEYRALYDIPPGTEICQSYVPISWSRKNRQSYLFDNFGFHCQCHRCNIESTIPEDEEDDDDDEEWEDEEVDDEVEVQDGIEESKTNLMENNLIDNDSDDVIDWNYITLYQMRHSCTKDDCCGILTPISGYCVDIVEQAMYECNVCGLRRSDAEFYTEVHETLG